MPKKEVRKSAVKTFKQSERVRLKNKACRSALWTAEKKLRAAVAEGSKETAAITRVFTVIHLRNAGCGDYIGK